MILNRELISLFIATITINLAANLIGPFFPLYFQSLGASLVMAGLLVSTINLIQMILRIPGGLIADRLRRKRSLYYASFSRWFLLSLSFSLRVGSRQCLGWRCTLFLYLYSSLSGTLLLPTTLKPSKERASLAL